MADLSEEKAAGQLKEIDSLLAVLKAKADTSGKRLGDVQAMRDSILRDVPQDVGGTGPGTWKATNDETRKQLLIRLGDLKRACHRLSHAGPSDPSNIMYYEYATKRQIYWLSAYGGVLTLALSFAINFYWGQATDSKDAASAFLFVVILAGGLGGCLRLIPSLVSYVGNRELLRSWLLHYYAMPILGVGLAPLIYFLFFAGQINGQSPDDAAHRLHLAVALAALTGLFAKDGMDKLKDIYRTVFGTDPHGKDKLTES